MKKLFLASSIDRTGVAVGREIAQNLRKLKLAFIYTAAEPEGLDEEWLKNDRRGLEKAGFKIFDYTITGKNGKQIDKDLRNADVIHVNGGNSFYLVLQARKSGFDIWIRREAEKGRIYTSSSAGSIAAAADVKASRKVETNKYEKELKSFSGFGLVDFLVLPHWGSKDFKDKYLNHKLAHAYRPENKIILLNDWQYVKVEGESYRIVDIRDQ